MLRWSACIEQYIWFTLITAAMVMKAGGGHYKSSADGGNSNSGDR
jgi:uncharacterized membrane protein YkvI